MKFARDMMHHIRPVGEEETPMFENEGMREVRLSRQIQNDRQRTLVRNTAEIKRAKACLGRTQNKELQNELRKRIEKLEAENKQQQRHL